MAGEVRLAPFDEAAGSASHCPAELCVRAEGGAAERRDPAADHQLAETDVLGGDHDVCGQGELDRQGERDAIGS